MSIIARKTNPLTSDVYRLIIILSAWGFALVMTSLLFLWLGYLLDELLGTAPKFMLGLFVLGIIGCFIEIYQEAIMTLSENKQCDVRSASRIIPEANNLKVTKGGAGL